MEELLKELEEAKAKIAYIEKKIEEKQEKEKSGRWKPQKGDIYIGSSVVDVLVKVGGITIL